MRRNPIGGAAVMLFVAAVVAAAQERAVEPGERVRLQAPRFGERPVYGRLVEITGSNLILDAEPMAHQRALRLDVALGEIASLEVARGKKPNWSAALKKGALIGIGATVMGGAFGGSSSCVMTDQFGCSWDELLIMGAAMTTVLVVGHGLFGEKTDRWVDVTPARTRLTIAPYPGRGVAIALSVRF